ncbi:MAG: hypothetical protein DRQ88_09930 [Epsilonproteobacteria bacterium]|nr:MAG: hypothetical protein DRQ89_10445 [Campylobacterota bacterium]RLA65016.1 MAG: hypothetical protein DRQ88_09930 [Campylobacterota bacterium]
MLSKKNKLDNGWKDFINRCFEKLSPSFKFQIAYKRDDFKTSNKLAGKIKKFLSREDLSKVKKIFKTREKIHKIKKWDNSFVAAMKLGFDEKHKIKIYRQNKNILTAIENEGKSFLSGILKIIVAIRVDNQAWAKKIIREFINMGPAEMIFYHHLGENHDARTLRQLFMQFLDKVNNFLSDVKWKKMFFNQLAILTNSAEMPLDLDQWDANWSFQEIKDQYKSQNYGIPYLGFWYEMYNYNTFPAQVDRFMKDELTGDNIKKWGRNYPWLFSYYFPENEKSQEEVLKIMDELVKSKIMYDKYLMLQLLGNLNESKNFKVLNKIKKRYPSLSRPLFQQKRRFYMDLLSKGEVVDFSIYQLLRLKDIVVEKDILWWVTF